MKTVHEYTIPDLEEDYFSLELPKGAKILSVQRQPDNGKIWALVDTEAKEEKRSFRQFETGAPIVYNLKTLKYIGTLRVRHGGAVGHVFEIV